MKQTASTPFITFMLATILETLATQATPTVAPTLTPTVKKLLAACTGEMSRETLQRKIGLKDKVNFIRNYLKPALNQGLIGRTIPDKPNSRLQQYRLTAAGRAANHPSPKATAGSAKYTKRKRSQQLPPRMSHLSVKQGNGSPTATYPSSPNLTPKTGGRR